jgi:hypothetical protein
MSVVILGIAISWIAFSGFLVTIVCMNSSRLSRIDEPFKSKSRVARARRRSMNQGQSTAIQAQAEF